jgi:acyl-coenzyme A synthetase/AMP-(fatty) acid ligase
MIWTIEEGPMSRAEAVGETATGTQSLERAVTLLREVASHGNRGARLTDLVADSGLSKATVRRLLAALIRESLLEQDESTRRYYLGADTFVLGTIAAARFGTHNLGANAVARLSALSHAKYVGDTIPLAALLCDRHKSSEQGSAVALIYESAAGHTSRLTYAELFDHSRRFAAVLRSLGVSKGDRVATLLPKGPELLIAMLATWRLGAILVPLFTAFGSPAVSYRLTHSGSKVLVTNRTFRGSVTPEVAAVIRVIVVEGDGTFPGLTNDLSFWSNLHLASPLDTVTTLRGDEPFILLYTLSIGGAPKGILVPVAALAGIEEHMRLGLDLRDDDVYWNLGDPAWGGGLYYAVIGPLLLGRSTILCDGPFDAGQIYRVLVKHKVTNLAASPNWYRAMRASEKLQTTSGELRLRVASSLGELLPDELIHWAAERLGVRLHDHYGQAETGVFVSNHQAVTLQFRRPPGSIGHQVPGFKVVILDATGRECPTDESGEIAIDTEKSPLHWFDRYYSESEGTSVRYRFGRRYYLTGDLGRMDAEGNVYYVGTKEDAISSSGYLIVPSQIEAALISHPAVAEAAIVGKPDRLRGEVIKAFVVLKSGLIASPAVAEEIAQHVRGHLPPYSLPPEIEFMAKLPRTFGGKLYRRTLTGRRTGSAADAK